jgi:hypothetical protein
MQQQQQQAALAYKYAAGNSGIRQQSAWQRTGGSCGSTLQRSAADKDIKPVTFMFHLQVDPADVVIVEGILVLHVPELRSSLLLSS